jgi:hypothetical protein
MANDVKIRLTDEQRAKIKEGTGKDLGEIRVSNLGSNPAVTPSPSAKVAAPRNAAPRNAAPRNAAPRNAAPRNAAPRNAAPRNAAPRNAAPRKSF